MRPRKLRLLIINDQEAAIGTDHIEVVKCPNQYGREISRLANWKQHMYMWGNAEVPEFDLLLIDIKFERDTYDPPYFGETTAIENNAPLPPNPFGLLHALPLVARQDLTNMPFVWGVHSGDSSAVKDDPVAIWAFGLLFAMERRDGWDGYGKGSAPAYFSEQIESLQALPADVAWRDLVPRYRDKLREASIDGRLSIDAKSLTALTNLADSSTKEDQERLAQSHLRIYSGPKPQEVQLRSLFAELEEWNETTIASLVKPYLQKLSTESEEFNNIFPKVCAVIKLLNKASELSEDAATDAAKHKSVAALIPRKGRPLVGVGVLVCLWLTHFLEGTVCRPSDLIAEMGFGEGEGANWHTVRRWLMSTGWDMRPEEFLGFLEKNELSPVLQQCGRLYYRNVLGWSSGKRWPRCIGEAPG